MEAAAGDQGGRGAGSGAGEHLDGQLEEDTKIGVGERTLTDSGDAVVVVRQSLWCRRRDEIRGRGVV